MAVSASSAKPKFFVGAFNYTTGLSIPVTDAINSYTLEFTTTISNQLDNYDATGDPNIYVLFSVTLDGETIYENSQYGWTSSGTAPTDPDATIFVQQVPSFEETVTINNYNPMITDSGGGLSFGTYVISAEVVYINSDEDYITDGATAFTPAEFDFTPKEADITYYYDTLVPKLNVTDETNYTFSGELPSRDTEFVLYPPENRTAQTNTLNDIQSVNYSTFYSGGNEVRYTILMEYDLTDQVIVNVQQDYKSFTIYRVDRCKLYDCLNEQYNLWVSSTCSGSLRQQRQDNYNKANGLALQILTGQSCNKESLTELIEAFNALCDCDCDCLDETPTLIQPSTAITGGNIQVVTTSTSGTEIDLAEGRVVYVNVTNDTEISVTNIELYKEYRFIFSSTSGDDLVTFATDDFQDDSGAVQGANLSSDGDLIMDFYADQTNILTLVSRSDTDGLESVSGTVQEIDVDTSDPANPILSLATEVTDSLDLANSAVQSVVSGTGTGVNNSDPQNPIVSLSPATQASLSLADSALQDNEQTVTASTAATAIDLSAGNVVIVNSSTNTELQPSNITDGGRYTFILNSTSGTDTITFESGVFYADTGGVSSATANNTLGARTVLEFYAVTASTLILTNRNDV